MKRSDKISGITAPIASLLAEPARTVTGLTDDEVAETTVDTRIFLRDEDDEDSDIIVARTVERNVALDVISETRWDIANNPMITDATTDQDVDTQVLSTGTTVLTITGTDFGADDEDLDVILILRQKATADTCLTSTGNRNRLTFPAAITSVSVGDDEIVASIRLNSQPGRVLLPGTGHCEVQVINHKRGLVSNKFILDLV